MSVDLTKLTIGEMAYFEDHAGTPLLTWINAMSQGEISARGLAPLVTIIMRRTAAPDYQLRQAEALAMDEAMALITETLDVGDEDPE